MDNKAFNDFLNQDFKGLSNWIYSLNPYEFTLIACLVGFGIAPFLTANQQNSMGNFFEQIGQTLLTIGAQNMTVSQQNTPSNNQIIEELERIKREIIRIRNEFNNK